MVEYDFVIKNRVTKVTIFKNLDSFFRKLLYKTTDTKIIMNTLIFINLILVDQLYKRVQILHNSSTFLHKFRRFRTHGINDVKIQSNRHKIMHRSRNPIQRCIVRLRREEITRENNSRDAMNHVNRHPNSEQFIKAFHLLVQKCIKIHNTLNFKIFYAT